MKGTAETALATAEEIEQVYLEGWKRGLKAIAIYRDGSKRSKEELSALGANTSLVHVDWMIGSGELDVDGISADGTAEPLMRKGEWAI
mgnify:CR=1 FL=1